MSHILFDALPGRTAQAQGKEYLFFSGYGYLGMQFVPAFTALVKEGIDKYGWLFPSSRISNTRIALFEECEQLLSSITNCEDTVLVSSGYTAGRLATEPWKEKIINLRPSHPAIKRTNNQIPQGVYGIDAVDILTASLTNIAAATTGLPLKTLIIDDSHGTGITGKHGEGASGYAEKKEGVDNIFTYSLSKAWGLNAGAVSCPSSIAEIYRQAPGYAAATAPSPALLYAFLHGQDIYAHQREKLRENIDYFRSAIAAIKGITYHPSLPIFVLPPGINENALFNKNIIISSFAYPDPTGPKIQRAVLNALHTKNDLEHLAGCLMEMI